MPLGQLKTKEEIIAECKQQVFAAIQVCTDKAYDAWRIEQDRIAREYLNGAPGGYPPSRAQASINRIKCEDAAPYGCPNPSGYPNAAEEARGRAACQDCLDKYLKETGDLEQKRSTESDANQRKYQAAVKACNDQYAKLLSDCINRQGGPIPSSPTTAPIVPVPTSPVRLDVPRDLRGYPLDPADYRWQRLYGTIDTIS